MKLRTDFIDRNELSDYLRETFPQSAAHSPEISEIRGGRKAAEKLLAQIDPVKYSKTRNYLDGAITGLSPYLRHGVLTLDEVRVLALQRAGKAAEKLVNELGWRDYWQRVYQQIGDGVWKDRESYKTGFRPADYAPELPDDIRTGKTGLACVDAFSHELHTTGFLHNHVRMWVASYVIHWRRVRWQAGAKWFLEHLLDGDPASNNLSWQWIASTFSSKPYYFNRENIDQFTEGKFCRQCPLNVQGCPFEASYEELQHQLFPKMNTDNSGGGRR
jgi:deoxyribodipyrimidine photo-lyase